MCKYWSVVFVLKCVIQLVAVLLDKLVDVCDTGLMLLYP